LLIRDSLELFGVNEVLMLKRGFGSEWRDAKKTERLGLGLGLDSINMNLHSRISELHPISYVNIHILTRNPSSFDDIFVVPP
jgi:hypothetical protein